MPLNARSIINKSSMIQVLVDEHEPDVLFITETFLNDDIGSYEILPRNFIDFRHDRNRHGGGVLIAVHHGLSVTKCDNLVIDAEFKCCRLEVENEKSIHIAVFYRPLSSDITYLNKLQNVMSLLYRHGVKRLVLTGDFNIPGINWKDVHPEGKTNIEKSLLDIVHEFSLKQHVGESNSAWQS